MIEIKNSAEHNNAINSYQYVVFFFGSNHCGICTKIKPVFEELAQSNPNVYFAHVETSTVKSDGLKGTPTFVAYRGGQVYGQVLGANIPQLATLVSDLQR